ncbi:MAG: aminotransferase class III-fold pyridoxal phosphate-dependent enzyme, partial [Verrucomicrobiales bacterium]
EYLRRATVQDVAAFVLEPIQGWAGTVMPPDDFFPKLRRYCDQANLLLVTDEILTGMGRTGKWLCTEHWEVVPDVVTLGKSLGNGFPVSCVAVREPFQEALNATATSTSYGGNPMACAAALATIETIESQGLLAQARRLGDVALQRMARMQAEHPLVGDVRAKGCLMGIEFVRDRATKTPWEEVGARVYEKAFRKGLVTIPGGHILRLSPPVVMTEEALLKGLDIIDESIGETADELGNGD